jgi:hypothetical protein
MATNPHRPPTTAEIRESRRQVTNLMRHPGHRPELPLPVVHYALDLDKPPIIACDAPDNPPSTTITTDVTCPDCMSHEQFPQSVVRSLQQPLPIQPESPPAIRGYDVLTTAALLLSDGDNPEYDRAIVELTSALIGATSDDRDLMTRILQTLKEGL